MRSAPHFAVAHAKSATAAENLALLTAYHAGKTMKAREHARHQLVLRNQGLVKTIALKFRPLTCLPFDDLISEGQVALMLAIDGYRLDSTAAFTTYAGRAIYRAIHRFIVLNEKAITLPDCAFRKHASPAIRAAAAKARKIVSIHNTITKRVYGSKARQAQFADLIPEPETEPAPDPVEVEQRQQQARATVLGLLDGLSLRQRVAIEHTFEIVPPPGHMPTAAAVQQFDLTNRNLVQNKAVAMQRLRRAVRRELRA